MTDTLLTLVGAYGRDYNNKIDIRKTLGTLLNN